MPAPSTNPRRAPAALRGSGTRWCTPSRPTSTNSKASRERRAVDDRALSLSQRGGFPQNEYRKVCADRSVAPVRRADGGHWRTAGAEPLDRQTAGVCRRGSQLHGFRLRKDLPLMWAWLAIPWVRKLAGAALAVAAIAGIAFAIYHAGVHARAPAEAGEENEAGP